MVSFRPLARIAAVLTTPPLAPEDVLALFNPVYSSRQLRGIVTRVVQETAQSATIFFRPGRGWHAHLAGQWARIGVDLNGGVRQWRSYSLSAPAGKDPAITVTDVGSVSGTWSGRPGLVTSFFWLRLRATLSSRSTPPVHSSCSLREAASHPSCR